MATLERVRTVFTGVAGTPWYSNMYFDNGVGEAGLYVEFVLDFWTTVANSIYSSVDFVVEDAVVIIEDTTGEIVGAGTGEGGGGSGQSGMDPVPYATQLQINWLTGVYLGGRQLRGKTYVPGLTESSYTLGLVSAGARTIVQGAADELIGSGGANGAFRVYSPTRGTSAVIDSATIPNKPAVLRSRRD